MGTSVCLRCRLRLVVVVVLGFCGAAWAAIRLRGLRLTRDNFKAGRATGESLSSSIVSVMLIYCGFRQNSEDSDRHEQRLFFWRR